MKLTDIICSAIVAAVVIDPMQISSIEAKVANENLVTEQFSSSSSRGRNESYTSHFFEQLGYSIIVLDSDDVSDDDSIYSLKDGQLLKLNKVSLKDFTSDKLRSFKEWVKRGNYVWVEVTDLVGEFGVRSQVYGDNIFGGEIRSRMILPDKELGIKIIPHYITQNVERLEAIEKGYVYSGNINPSNFKPIINFYSISTKRFISYLGIIPYGQGIIIFDSLHLDEEGLRKSYDGRILEKNILEYMKQRRRD